MQILHLFDSYLPTTLNWVSGLLTHLPEVEVQIGAPWIVQGQFYNKSFKHYLFPPQRWCFSAPATESQLPFWQLFFTRSQRFLPLYRFWLSSQLSRFPPDVLHAHFGPTGCLYMPLAKKLDRPLVVTFYGFDYQKLVHQRPVFRHKYKRLFDRAALVLAASTTGCEALEAMGCPIEKLAVVRPSLDLTLFPFVKRQKMVGRLNMVQVATFTPKKGYLTTLEAFCLALKDCPNLHLTLAGEKYDQVLIRQVERFIQDHRLEKHVAWLPPIPHDQLAAFFTGFDVFIHPSCFTTDGDHEATPVVLLEAQATGLPVLSTLHFDIPLEVLHQRTGLLAPEHDVPELALHIKRFYQMDNPEYQQFSTAAHRHVEAGFDIRNTAKNLLELYKRVVISCHQSLGH